MGVVYRASHLQLRRTVALKVLPPSLTADREYRHRFEREAAIAASLEHPNVVPIYDAGYANGVLYLSMRFVDGEDLGAVLQREGRLDVEPLCALLEPVADALDAVHAAGLVHRDVKPGNVLISRSARSAGSTCTCATSASPRRPPGGRELTAAGQYMGTVHYSSPEQIEGRWVDGRSDQYGLACLAFRALTGQVPYPRPETAAVIYAHLAADPPRPSLQRADLPPAVDAAVARATAKQPERRFATCTDFIAALRAAVQPPAPRPGPGDRCPPRCRCRSPSHRAPPTGAAGTAPPPPPRPPCRRGRAPDAPGRPPSPRRRTCGPSAAPTTRRSRSPGRHGRAATSSTRSPGWPPTAGGTSSGAPARPTWSTGPSRPTPRSPRTRSSPGSGRRPPRRSRSATADPGGIPAVRNLTVSPGGALVFDWRRRRHRGDGGGPRRPPAGGARRPGRHRLEDHQHALPARRRPRAAQVGGAALPRRRGVLRRKGGTLVVAPGFGASARAAVGLTPVA